VVTCCSRVQARVYAAEEHPQAWCDDVGNCPTCCRE
jgi:hypothetical protein